VGRRAHLAVATKIQAEEGVFEALAEKTGRSLLLLFLAPNPWHLAPQKLAGQTSLIPAEAPPEKTLLG